MTRIAAAAFIVLILGAVFGVTAALYFFVTRDVTLSQSDQKFDVLVNLLLIFLGLFALVAGILYAILSNLIEQRIRDKVKEDHYALSMSMKIAEALNYWETFSVASTLRRELEELRSELSLSTGDSPDADNTLGRLLVYAIEASESALYKDAPEIDEDKNEETITTAKNNLAYYLALRGATGDCDQATRLIAEVERLIPKYRRNEAQWRHTIATVRSRCLDASQAAEADRLRGTGYWCRVWSKVTEGIHEVVKSLRNKPE